MTDPNAPLTVHALSKALEPLAMEDVRRDHRDRVVVIAGIIGAIRGDLSMHLDTKRLTPAARSAAIDLVDSGLLDLSEGGIPFVTRLPVSAGEVRLLHVALGLRGRK